MCRMGRLVMFREDDAGGASDSTVNVRLSGRALGSLEMVRKSDGGQESSGDCRGGGCCRAVNGKGRGEKRCQGVANWTCRKRGC